jgi:hypothetical protein
MNTASSARVLVLSELGCGERAAFLVLFPGLWAVSMVWCSRLAWSVFLACFGSAMVGLLVSGVRYDGAVSLREVSVHALVVRFVLSAVGCN